MLALAGAEDEDGDGDPWLGEGGREVHAGYNLRKGPPREELDRLGAG